MMLVPGTLVMPHVNAQHHQHMFCARIDPAIDDTHGGKDLVVTEVIDHSLFPLIVFAFYSLVFFGFDWNALGGCETFLFFGVLWF